MFLSQPETSSRRAPRGVVGLLALLLVAGACASGSDDGADNGSSGQAMVAPDFESETFVVNVALTDTGFEPSTVFIPAGRHVQLVLRNRGSHEHHYRVIGLVASELRWYLYPETDISDLDSMTPAELEALGISGEIDDPEHVLHHLVPSFVPFKDASRSGIKPLPNEVHGYAQARDSDVLTFYPLSPGTFVVEDVLYPEIVGRVVVFEAKT